MIELKIDRESELIAELFRSYKNTSKINWNLFKIH